MFQEHETEAINVQAKLPGTFMCVCMGVCLYVCMYLYPFASCYIVTEHAADVVEIVDGRKNKYFKSCHNCAECIKREHNSSSNSSDKLYATPPQTPSASPPTTFVNHFTVNYNLTPGALGHEQSSSNPPSPRDSLSSNSSQQQPQENIYCQPESSNSQPGLIQRHAKPHDGTGEEAEESKLFDRDVPQKHTEGIHHDPPPKSEKEKTWSDVHQDLFSLGPYSWFGEHQRDIFKIKVLVWVFCVYQFSICVLHVICEEGGLRAVFHNPLNRATEIAHRLAALGIRVLLRVIAPVVCTHHLSALASVQAEDLLPATHAREPVKHSVASSLKEMHKHLKIKTSVAFSACYIGLVFHLDLFFLLEENAMEGGVCEFFHHDLRIFSLSMNHIFCSLEALSLLVIMLIAGVVKEFYYYENRISIELVKSGDKGAVAYSRNLRGRWDKLDRLLYVAPHLTTLCLMASYSTGMAFSPTPLHRMEPSTFVTWFFWMAMLMSLVFASMSPSSDLKAAALIVCCAVLLPAAALKLKHVMKLQTTSLMPLLVAGTVAANSQLLYSLGKYHRKARHSCLHYYSTVGIVILLSSLVVCCFREAYHFAGYVKW